jgi:uncharacterized membrane protein YcaP (DUF421 family)
MDKSEIHLDDIQRILFGNAPVTFMLEVLFRTVVVYTCLLIVVKFMGKRMSGHLTITELGIAIMLGAIIAPPMETPERGILQGIFILVLVLAYHQGIALLGVHHPKLEKITQGRISIFVKDGVLQLEAIKKTKISRAQLFAILRNKNVFNLGKVKRLYMEAGGAFSLYERKVAAPGLSLLPASDDNIHAIQQKPDENLKACISCGKTAFSSDKPCTVCGHDHWDTAVL